MQLLLDPAKLGHSPLSILLGLNKFLYLLEGEVSKVIVDGALLHNIRGNGGVLKAPHPGVQDHSFQVAGLAVN